MHGMKEPKPLRHVVSTEKGTGARMWKYMRGSTQGGMNPLRGRETSPLAGELVGGNVAGGRCGWLPHPFLSEEEPFLGGAACITPEERTQ